MNKINLKMLNEDLFIKLKEWRLYKAKQLGKAAYLIFHDSTLTELSKAKINQKTDLMQIKGIGPSKIKEYGDEIKSILENHYCKLKEKQETHKKKKIKDLTKQKSLPIYIDPLTEQRIKSHLKGRASEMIIKYIFKESGYQVLRGEKWLDYNISKNMDKFRDGEQIKRLNMCLSICKLKKIGLPDFFIYSDTDEFFLEVKSNDANLNGNQKESFPEINKLVPIKIARVNMNFLMRSLGITLDDFE